MNRLILLGSGTCQLQSDRMAASVLLEPETDNILFDIGRGTLRRLTDLGLRQDELQHIIISHFHPDHISDLIPYLHAARWSQTDPRTMDLHLYGPTGLKTFIADLIALFGARALTSDAFTLHVHEIAAGVHPVGSITVTFTHLPPHNNHGAKFSINGKTYGLTGDAGFHEMEVKFLTRCDIGIIDAGHITDEEIISLAVQSQVKTLVCSHLYRNVEADKLTERARKKGFHGTIIMAYDMMVFQL